MKYFPLFLNLENQPVLIVGGGETALQKLRLLAKTEARISVMALRFHPEIEALGESQNSITLIERAFDAGDAANQRLLYAASDDETLDNLVVESGRAAGVLVNKVDCPENCDFITPSIVDRDPIVVAIGTEGAAPLLAREIKGKLDRLLPSNFGLLARFAARIRPRILKGISDGRQRLRFWEALMAPNSAVRQALLKGEKTRAETEFDGQLAKALEPAGLGTPQKTGEEAGKGSVALIGAGPGDADLLTLKALHYLQTADVLVIDRLIGNKILDYARRDAKRIFVGKQAGKRSIAQEEINQILVREALKGARVVRVKGGDPNVFGRMQEELAACQHIGIDVEVVPGISAAQAASASIRLPLTYRGVHRSITWITAATRDQIVAEDLIGFMKTGRPFGVYMGLKLVDEIVRELAKAGADMAQEIVLVENASRDDERVFAASLKDLSLAVRNFDITGPTIMLFGLSYEEMGLQPDPRLERFEASNVISLSLQVS